VFEAVLSLQDPTNRSCIDNGPRPYHCERLREASGRGSEWKLLFFKLLTWSFRRGAPTRIRAWGGDTVHWSGAHVSHRRNHNRSSGVPGEIPVGQVSRIVLDLVNNQVKDPEVTESTVLENF